MVEPCVLLGTDDVRLNGNGFVIELKALASVVGENDVIVLLMPGEEEREVKMVDGGYTCKLKVHRNRNRRCCSFFCRLL